MCYNQSIVDVKVRWFLKKKKKMSKQERLNAWRCKSYDSLAVFMKPLKYRDVLDIWKCGCADADIYFLKLRMRMEMQMSDDYNLSDADTYADYKIKGLCILNC